MKYSIYQLQAFEFLKERVLSVEDFFIQNRDLKLVFKYNNDLWVGNFLLFDDNACPQEMIKNNAGVFHLRTYASYHAEILKKVTNSWQSYDDQFFDSPLCKVITLPTFFDFMVDVISTANITKDDSPFAPRLYNAKRLDSNIELPFIDLDSDVELELVSILDVTQETNA